VEPKSHYQLKLEHKQSNHQWLHQWEDQLLLKNQLQVNFHLLLLVTKQEVLQVPLLKL